MEIAIIGGGIGGLTLALELHAAGIRTRVFEAAPEVAPLGVGINLLPHAMVILGQLGLESELSAAGIVTEEAAYFNRFGQLIAREPLGRFAHYPAPQISIHRADLHQVLLAAVRERLGADAIVLGHRCTGVVQDSSGVTVEFQHGDEGLTAVRADAAVACDGIHSVVRKQFYPEEGEPRYSGVNMWRGVTRWPPFLTGASMVRVGWFTPGKMVIYPIRDVIDPAGNQLVNWVAEVETPQHLTRDWNRRGELTDFIGAFDTWRFDWLDVPALIRAADVVLEYPMVDQQPIPRWSFGRVTLLGDAAHPMVPRGSNGAGQAILDARELRKALVDTGDVEAALNRYEAVRIPATSAVVQANHDIPPDSLIKEVVDRTGDSPFEDIDDVISPAEVDAIFDRYKRIAGYAKEDVIASMEA